MNNIFFILEGTLRSFRKMTSIGTTIIITSLHWPSCNPCSFCFMVHDETDKAEIFTGYFPSIRFCLCFSAVHIAYISQYKHTVFRIDL